MNIRNTARMAACQQQDITVNESVRQAGEEYIDDILEHMDAMEV